MKIHHCEYYEFLKWFGGSCRQMTEKPRSTLGIRAILWENRITLSGRMDVQYDTYSESSELFGSCIRTKVWNIKRCFTSWRNNKRKSKYSFELLLHCMEVHHSTYLESSKSFGGFRSAKAKKWYSSWRVIMRNSKITFRYSFRWIDVHYHTYLESFKLFDGWCRANGWKAEKGLTSWLNTLRKLKISFG